MTNSQNLQNIFDTFGILSFTSYLWICVTRSMEYHMGQESSCSMHLIICFNTSLAGNYFKMTAMGCKNILQHLGYFLFKNVLFENNFKNHIFKNMMTFKNVLYDMWERSANIYLILRTGLTFRQLSQTVQLTRR